MLPDLSRRILAGWRDFFPITDKPETLCYMGIPGSVEGGTTTFLAFPKGCPRPSFVVKIHRDPGEQARVFIERDILNHLQEKGGLLAESVPKLILCEKIAGQWVLVESVLDGSPMIATMTDGGMPELKEAKHNISLAASWLVELRAVTRADSTPLLGQLKEGGLKTISEFSNTFELSRSEKDYLGEISDSLKVTEDFEWFIQHGDFCRHNILVSQNAGSVEEMGVIDWTFGKRAGLPLHDLFFFITTYFLQIRKGHGLKGFIQAFEATFFDRNPFSKIVKQCVSEHCLKVDVDASQVKNLFAMFVVERAMFEFEQMVQCAKRGGLPRFTLYLASQENLDYFQATKAQFWIHFFKTFVALRRKFLT